MRFVTALVALLIVIPCTGLAQTTTRASEEPRFFVNINPSGTAYSPAKPREFTSLFLVFAEVGSMQASYPKPSRASLPPLRDLGGGFMFTRRVGIGISYGRADFEDVVGLAATIPHPNFLGAPASGTGVTSDALSRREATTNVFIVLVPVRFNHAQVRVFAGPSFFSYKADMVEDILFGQAFDPMLPANTITIDGFTSRNVKGRDIGVHVGGEFAYFFTRMLGIAGGVRLSRGTVTVDEEPLSRLTQEIRVGGRLVYLGAHVRFGR